MPTSYFALQLKRDPKGCLEHLKLLHQDIPENFEYCDSNSAEDRELQKAKKYFLIMSESSSS